MVLVDHLHITRPEAGDARHGGTYAVGQISQALKRMAKILKVPVIALAQLSREVERRDDKRPSLPDLRQSGDIEQDADLIAFLFRPEYYLGTAPPEETISKFRSKEDQANAASRWLADKDRLKGKAELIIAKNRDGAACTIPLLFHAETTSFTEPPDDTHEDPETSI